MYGLVNRAIADFAKRQGGDEAWQAILEKSGVTTRRFLSMETYPDQVTYDLVAAASEVFELPAETILREFGRSWVQFVTEQGFGTLLRLLGSNLRDSLSNLDALHLRVRAGMPKLNPPSFRSEVIGDDAIRLHYHSERKGLLPMVIGLVESLAESYGETVEINAVESVESDQQILEIQFVEAAITN